MLIIIIINNILIIIIIIIIINILIIIINNYYYYNYNIENNTWVRGNTRFISSVEHVFVNNVDGHTLLR